MDINENEEQIEEELEQVLPELEDLPIIESDDIVDTDEDITVEVEAEEPSDPDTEEPSEPQVDESAESETEETEQLEMIELEELPPVDPEDSIEEEADDAVVEEIPDPSELEEDQPPAAEEEQTEIVSPEMEEPVMVEEGEVVVDEKEISPEISALAEPVIDDGRAWYVVHCYSGNEDKVRHNIVQRIESMSMDDLIFDVVVPTEDEVNIKNGERQTVEKKVFPGYILVNMTLTEESWYMVRNTPGVTGFVGMGNDPTALQPEEVARILKRMESDSPRINVTFRQGERVRIVDGPFEDFYGKVSEINMDRATVRVMVNFFGRETPVELDFLQVEEA
jgi:transcriptional antiterminator NusG